MGGSNEDRGVLINEKRNQGVRERKRLGFIALEVEAIEKLPCIHV
jgi:hypothetical protein